MQVDYELEYQEAAEELSADELDENSAVATAPRFQFWQFVLLFVLLLIGAALLVFVVLPYIQQTFFAPPPLPALQAPLQT